MTVEDVWKKWNMGAGVFSREEIEALLKALQEQGYELG